MFLSIYYKGRYVYQYILAVVSMYLYYSHCGVSSTCTHRSLQRAGAAGRSWQHHRQLPTAIAGGRGDERGRQRGQSGVGGLCARDGPQRRPIGGRADGADGGRVTVNQHARRLRTVQKIGTRASYMSIVNMFFASRSQSP